MRAGEATGGVDRDDPVRSGDGMLVRRRSAGTGAARDTAQGTQTERMACWWWPQTPRQIPRGPPPRACERPDSTVMRAAHGPGPCSRSDNNECKSTLPRKEIGVGCLSLSTEDTDAIHHLDYWSLNGETLIFGIIL